MLEEVEDDFDRFCRIGRGSSSEYSPNRPVRLDLLAAPTEISRYRAGSLRETRHRPHHRNDSSATRGRFSRTTTADDFSVHRHSTSTLRRHSLAPSFQNLRLRGSPQYPSEDVSDDRSSSIRALTPTTQMSPRARNGSSGGVIPPPINVYHDIDSSEHSGLNIVRVRSFRRTKEGVVSEGDRDVSVAEELDMRRKLSQELSSPSRRMSKSRSSKISPGELKLSDRCEAARSIRKLSFSGGGGGSWSNNPASDHSDEDSVQTAGLGNVSQPYTVQVLGAEQVGKTTMCTQFLTSESLYDGFDSADEGNVLETVTVDVDGQQTSLLLIDSNGNEETEFSVIDSADAYLVVYAIDDRESFKKAQTIISEILGRCKIASAIVLVGNKSDLVRARSVSLDEGKHLASVYSCGFYEVSIALNHQVNELLVGLVWAIKAANQHVEEERERLSRIASIKTDAGDGSSSHERTSSLKNKIPFPRHHSGMGKAIKRFFKKHFSVNGV
ncbi:unnamed protein product [Mesocestoides corti]|uniref:GTP-binding protein GEM n=1 Tax=Mesocestoides corti TaxID=53468 RepID=A0A158QUF3_MESCO|nr:unnamed protein product [Mesocestoides corti]